MNTISVLNIQEFEPEVEMSNFYSNDFKTHLHKNKNLFNKPHSHDFYLCVMFTKGIGTHEIDFNSYPVKAGSVFFLKPGQTHYWTFTKQPEGYIFFHTRDFYELHFTKSKLEQFPFYFTQENSPSLQLTNDETLFIEAKFKEINKEYYSSLTYVKQKIASLIHSTYIDLARYYTQTKPIQKIASVTYLNTLNDLEKAIDKYYKQEKSASFYANLLHITPKHLNRITKSTLGKTTTDLITERVLLESKRLMVHSTNSLSQISELLGYNDYAYFSKVFKLKTNMTPLAFKKGYQNR